MRILEEAERRLWGYRHFLNVYGKLGLKKKVTKEWNDGYKEAMVDAFEEFEKVRNGEQ